MFFSQNPPPPPATVLAFTGAESLFADDAYLRPVLDADPFLRTYPTVSRACMYL